MLTWGFPSLSGNGNLTYDEKKSHWTAWALMKSPLFIGTNVGRIIILGTGAFANCVWVQAFGHYLRYA